MKIAVIGCGAMGSIYAAKLAAAGNDVIAIDSDEASMAQVAQHGLRVTGPGSDRVVPLRASTVAPAETMDLIVLAVKAADVIPGAQQALPMLGDSTAVLTIQNGLGSAETVAGIVGDERLAVGIASGFGASRVAPGHVHHNAMRAMRFGAYSALPHATVESIAHAWTAAGFDAAAVTDIAAMQWEKLMCNVAYSAPCALTHMTVGQVMDDPEMVRSARRPRRRHSTSPARRGSRSPSTDPVTHVREFGARMPDAKPSALLDHEARRVSEIDVINGAVPRQGARVGVDAPVNATLTAIVKSVERQWS